MVSKRNFLVITLIMCLVLFMFLFSGLVREMYNDYDHNVYADDKSTLTSTSMASTLTNPELVLKSTQDFVVLIGNTDDKSVGATVLQWCKYNKRNIITYSSITEYSIERLPEAIFIDSGYVDFKKDVMQLTRVASNGCPMIFCNLPDTKSITDDGNLRTLLGIERTNSTSCKLKGSRLFEGFLLGGEHWYLPQNSKEEEYQDMAVDIPWFTLRAGTKTYMAGVLTEDYGEVKPEGQPPIIWRNRTDDACVFVINGDFADGSQALGIYTAMMYESHDYMLYPIVNAQSIIMINFPSFAEENDQEMMKRYSRNSTATLRDIVWPNISYLTTKFNASITYMVTPQNNYEDINMPNEDELIYYFKLFRENGDEAGWAAYNLQEVTLRRKLLTDYETFSRAVPNYKFLSIYVNNYSKEKTLDMLKTNLLKNVKTVVVDYENNESLFTYVSNDVLEIHSTNEGLDYKYSKDFRNRSIETALGYSVITMDTSDVLYPNENSPEWTKKYEDFATNLNEYWKDFDIFNRCTVSEADDHIRDYMKLRYTQRRSKDVINIETNGHNKDVYFLLRTHNEDIDKVDGGTFKKIGKETYLVTLKEGKASIYLKPSKNLKYEP